jgi:hypothetical protein
MQLNCTKRPCFDFNVLVAGDILWNACLAALLQRAMRIIAQPTRHTQQQGCSPDLSVVMNHRLEVVLHATTSRPATFFGLMHRNVTVTPDTTYNNAEASTESGGHAADYISRTWLCQAHISHWTFFAVDTISPHMVAASGMWASCVRVALGSLPDFCESRKTSLDPYLLLPTELCQLSHLSHRNFS